MRDIAVGIWQKIAGKDLHDSKEHEKHRRAAKRLGPKLHLLSILPHYVSLPMLMSQLSGIPTEL